MHIPTPEYADSGLILRVGKRRAPTEGPSINSLFYNSKYQEGIAVLSCGHDHLNLFCALLPANESRQDGGKFPGRATEGEVGLGDIAHTATSDTTDERGFSILIQGLGVSRLGSRSNMVRKGLMNWKTPHLLTIYVRYSYPACTLN